MAEEQAQTRERVAPGEVAQENIRAVARLQKRAARRRSLTARACDAVAARAGSDGVIIAHLIWFTAWLLINTGYVAAIPVFDRFPFSLLTTIVSLEAIFLTLLVLGSQNRLNQEADHRAQLDLQVNLLSEQEMTLVLRMLREVCDHFDLRETTSTSKFKELAQRTDVGQLAEQVDHHLPIGRFADDGDKPV